MLRARGERGRVGNIVARLASTFMPGLTRSSPLMTTSSPGFSPEFTTRRPSTSRPSVTGRYSTLLSGLRIEHELAVLVRADRLVLDQRDRVLLRADEPDASEQPRHEELRSGCGMTARTRIVPAPGSSRLSTKSSFPSWGNPVSFVSPM